MRLKLETDFDENLKIKTQEFFEKNVKDFRNNTYKFFATKFRNLTKLKTKIVRLKEKVSEKLFTKFLFSEKTKAPAKLLFKRAQIGRASCRERV